MSDLQFVRFNPANVSVKKGAVLHIHVGDVNGYFIAKKRLVNRKSTVVYELIKK